MLWRFEKDNDDVWLIPKTGILSFTFLLPLKTRQAAQDTDTFSHDHFKSNRPLLTAQLSARRLRLAATRPQKALRAQSGIQWN